MNKIIFQKYITLQLCSERGPTENTGASRTYPKSYPKQHVFQRVRHDPNAQADRLHDTTTL